MKNERELFEEWAKSSTGLNLDKDENGLYISITTFMAFKSWQASVQREGYKLVPVEASELMLDAGLNCEHEIDNFVVIDEIYKAMIGAVND